jgi:hypothetical protein
MEGTSEGRTNERGRAEVMAAAILLAIMVATLAIVVVAPSASARGVSGTASSCLVAGSTGMTAKVIAHGNQTISGHVVNAAGCDIGIYIGPNAKHVTVRNTVVTGANDHGIFAQDSAHVLIVNNTVVGNGVLTATHSCNVGAPPCIPEDKAISLAGTSWSRVLGNFVEGNSADGGISVTDDSHFFDPSALLPGLDRAAVNNTVRSNLVENNDLGCGIIVAAYNAHVGVWNTTVQTNTVLGLSQQQEGGYLGFDVGQIVVAADGPNTTISGTWLIGNTIVGSLLPGIVLHSNAPGDIIMNTHILNNRIGDNSGYPSSFGSPNTPTLPTGISIVAEAYGQPHAPIIKNTFVTTDTVSNDAVGLWLCQSVTTAVHDLDTHHVTTVRATCSAGGS